MFIYLSYVPLRYENAGTPAPDERVRLEDPDRKASQSIRQITLHNNLFDRKHSIGYRTLFHLVLYTIIFQLKEKCLN